MMVIGGIQGRLWGIERGLVYTRNNRSPEGDSYVLG